MSTPMHASARVKLLFSVILIIFVSLFYSCQESDSVTDPGDDNDDDDPDNLTTVIFSGQVLNELTGIPVDSAYVRITGSELDIVLLTETDGTYGSEVEGESNQNFTIVAFKTSYYSDTTHVTGTGQNIVNIPTLRLKPLTQGDVNPSGPAASILVSSISPGSIGIRGGGGNETATITFQVVDSSGLPIDITHSTNLSFTFGGHPNGGEFIYPTQALTNERGQVSLTITSGFTAGVVQITATTSSGGKVITSKPVYISIHGGFPDQRHFSIAPQYLNFAGYNISGLLNGITAYVGDEYSNPVKPGTSVYFSSDGGIIEGSALTDEMGRASVALMSADPRPFHPQLGAGFATVTATTINRNSEIVMDQVVVLFSGVPELTLEPGAIDVANGGSQFFSYTVMDQNGNPLAPGTQIVVTPDGEDVSVSGNVDVTLPDTQSRAWTQFGFYLFDTNIIESTARSVTVTVTVTGPNGRAEVFVSGTVR